MNNNKVTYIEELFDLDDSSPSSHEQQSMQGYPPRMSQNYDKQMSLEIAEREASAKPLQSKIRQFNDPRIAMNGGVMPTYSNNNNDFFLVERGNQRPPIPRQEVRPLIQEDQEFEMGPRVMNMRYNPHHNHHRELSCMEIAQHVKNCPICSKFYDNDKSIYIVAIIILSIFCIILLKKILDMSMTRSQ